jgi:hypothetical protein
MARISINFLFLIGAVLLLVSTFTGQDLGFTYMVVSKILMGVIVVMIALRKPSMDGWLLALYIVLLVRFFIGDFLKEATSWYLTISYP